MTRPAIPGKCSGPSCPRGHFRGWKSCAPTFLAGLTARVQHVDDQAFHEHGESPLGLGPRHFDLKHAVLWALHARNPGMKEGLELAGVEVTPYPRLGMIPTSQLAATARTAPPDTGSVINMNIHSASRRAQLDVGNKPRVAQPQDPRIQVRVLHGRPPGLPISGHLPTEKSEGPTILLHAGAVIPDLARHHHTGIVVANGISPPVLCGVRGHSANRPRLRQGNPDDLDRQSALR